MAALNFPLSPEDGDVYGNYVYDATEGVWNANPRQLASRFVTSATQPSSPSNGDGWLDTNTGKTYIYYNDGSSAQWIESGNPVIGFVDPYDQTTTSTGYLALPKGTSAQRPVTPQNGDMRFNTESGSPEWYSSEYSTWINFSQVPAIQIDYLVVAGGGGGGHHTGGGGGAGGYREVSGETLSSGTYTITIGAGGPGGTANRGTNGTNSVFRNITSTGGGGGAGFDGNYVSALSGGSGGGGTSIVGGAGIGAAGNTPSTEPPQGNNGGNGLADPYYPGGGGGGAGAVGGNGSNTAPGSGGNGGAGISSNITGSLVTLAGGGGGGANSSASTPGSGGIGGGGAGAVSSAAGLPGTNNTGGGGGGGGGEGSTNDGGNGGSGVVILKVPSWIATTFSVGITEANSGNGQVVGDYKVYTVTAGTGTVTIS